MTPLSTPFECRNRREPRTFNRFCTVPVVRPPRVVQAPGRAGFNPGRIAASTLSPGLRSAVSPGSPFRLPFQLSALPPRLPPQFIPHPFPKSPILGYWTFLVRYWTFKMVHAPSPRIIFLSTTATHLTTLKKIDCIIGGHGVFNRTVFKRIHISAIDYEFDLNIQ